MEIDTCQGRKIVKLFFLAMCADLPARAAVSNMKQFNGKSPCHMCFDEGECRTNQPMLRFFPFNKHSQLRTHASVMEDAKKAVESGEAVSVNSLYLHAKQIGPNYSMSCMCFIKNFMRFKYW